MFYFYYKLSLNFALPNDQITLRFIELEKGH